MSKVNLRCRSLVLSVSSFFEPEFLTGTRRLLLRLDWLAREPQPSACSISPGLQLQAHVFNMGAEDLTHTSVASTLVNGSSLQPEDVSSHCEADNLQTYKHS